MLNSKPTYLLLILLFLTLSEQRPNRKICSHYRGHPVKQVSKKDLFVSRGWGASGMPFSVLYMKPYGTHQGRTQGPHDETPLALHSRQEKPQAVKQRKVEDGSNVPQLFVSYGWGPLGR